MRTYIGRLKLVLFLTSLTACLLQAQSTMNDPYTKEWSHIDSLDRQGLYRSAQDAVKALYARTVTDGKAEQSVKALLYWGKFEQQLSEDGDLAAIALLEGELAKAGFPVQPVLQSLLAELYYRHLSFNYWQIGRRTPNEGEDPGADLKLWTAADFIRKSTGLYLASLSDLRTRQIDISRFEAILTTAKNSAPLRPTLYDMLANRAIDHFSHSNAYLAEPAYAFRLNQSEAFAPVSGFIAHRFETQDTSSFVYRALMAFQELLRWRSEEARQRPEALAALVDADLRRLAFVNQQSQHSDKATLYKSALDALLARCQGKPEAGLVQAEIVGWHYQRGSDYTPEDPATAAQRWAWRDAIALCRQIERDYPGSAAARKAAEWSAQIRQPYLNVQTESAYLPDQAGLVYAAYTNIDKVYFRIVSLEERDYAQRNYDERKRWLVEMAGRKAIRRWEVNLPDPGDYRAHSTETSFAALPLGKYALLVSREPDFTSPEMDATFFWVSRLGLVHEYSGGAEGMEAVVVDRLTGAPQAGVKATLYTQANWGENWREIRTVTSDANGFLPLSQGRQRESIRIRLSKGKDEFFPLDPFYNYYYRSGNASWEQTVFFTDRGIYRPGQTIHFKALLMQYDPKGAPNLLAGRRVTIKLLDANGQEVAAQEFTSNGYGSVSGSFTAPEGRLLGYMTLQSSVGSSGASIRVEEYKRPRFEVKLDELEGQPRIGESVAVTGAALGYAGPAVAEAGFTFTVTRSVYFPWMPFWRRWGGPWNNRPQAVIATGTGTTDAEGRFKVVFTAAPDADANRKDHPVFAYNISVDITDVTGETHSATKTVNLSHTPIVANLQAPERHDNRQPLRIGISARNLDDKPVVAAGRLSVHRLQAPNQFFIDRYWETPDQPVISERDFKKAFPLLPYRDENERQNWPLAESRYDEAFRTGDADSLLLATANWPAGHYRIQFSLVSEGGDTLRTEQYVLVSDKGLLPAGILLDTEADRSAYQPGQSLGVALKTSQGETHVLTEMTRRDGRVSMGWHKAAPATRLNHNVEEADRGNIGLALAYVRYNRFFSEQLFFSVPWSNKELTITTETFRNKLQPGAAEEWVVRIDGPQKEKVAAELLASMYDASLDQLQPFDWAFQPFPYLSASANWLGGSFQAGGVGLTLLPISVPGDPVEIIHPDFDWFGLSPVYTNGAVYKSMARSAPGMAAEAEMATADMRAGAPPPPPAPVAAEIAAVQGQGGETDARTQSTTNTPPPVRANLQETAFFMPSLETDAQGRIALRFQAPEALTRWKLQLLAHTPDLQFALSTREVVTQKELMVQPNAPRFLREGDALAITAKVSNLTDKGMQGTARMELFDAATGAPLSAAYGLVSEQSFSVGAQGSTGLAWPLRVPAGATGAITYRVTVQSGSYSDGEENALPVLTNRTLVTEAIPLYVRGRQRRSFTLRNLESSGPSSSIQHQGLSLEITSNPAWLAVKALPYLQEYPHECTEQILNRFYANTISAGIANKYPRLRAVFESWKGSADALKSPLLTNQQLKSALLEETPWVLEAQDETTQRERIGLLFDLNQMAKARREALEQLAQRQEADGGFTWFPGGRTNAYVTQYVVEGLAHLRQLGVENFSNEPQVEQLLQKSIGYIDQQFVKHYQELARRVERKQATLEQDNLDALVVHYLYVRSFFPEQKADAERDRAWAYYLGQAEKYWLSRGLYEQGMIALALHRTGKLRQAQGILASLRERALRNDELGMYWKYAPGWRWNQLPIETHALLIEVFHTLGAPVEEVDELRLWLLKNKETNRWETTKATAAAVYALLATGESWLTESQPVAISFPKAPAAAYSQRIAQAEASAEAGTGYYQTQWTAAETGPSLATVQLDNRNKTAAWGGIYWQYFEDIDKVARHADSPLQLDRALYRERNTDAGKVLEPLAPGAVLQPGDKLTVRLTLRTDRDMEFVHLKDLRGSGLEPVVQLSNYRWQDGLGFYQSVTDLGMHFFFDYLPKGVYVLEHQLWVVHRGEFSNGVATLQSMYAPAFNSHSAGVRLEVR